ncbi:hypothetical protein [Pseudoalteromonas nigrifaciens]
MNEPIEQKQTGIIAYFAKNSVAANLMMFFIIVMGIITRQDHYKLNL